MTRLDQVKQKEFSRLVSFGAQKQIHFSRAQGAGVKGREYVKGLLQIKNPVTNSTPQCPQEQACVSFVTKNNEALSV